MDQPNSNMDVGSIPTRTTPPPAGHSRRGGRGRGRAAGGDSPPAEAPPPPPAPQGEARGGRGGRARGGRGRGGAQDSGGRGRGGRGSRGRDGAQDGRRPSRAPDEGGTVAPDEEGRLLKESFLPATKYDKYWKKILMELQVISFEDKPRECPLCASEASLWCASPDCNDCPDICYTCGLKSRVVDNVPTCRFCSVRASKLVFYSDSCGRERALASETLFLCDTLPVMRNKEIYTVHQNLPKVFELTLCQTICWMESCAGKDLLAGRIPGNQYHHKSVKDLDHHLRTHHQATNCKLCKKLHESELPIEQILYPIKDMARHRKKGDLLHNISRHPFCRWCDRYFTDDEALILHQNKEHQQCTLCKKELSDHYYSGDMDAVAHVGDTGHETESIVQKRSLHRGQGISLGYIDPEKTQAQAIFKDITELMRHNLTGHYPCPSPDCCLVTFKDFLAVKIHYEANHRSGDSFYEATRQHLKDCGVKPGSVLLMKGLRGNLPEEPAKSPKAERPSVPNKEDAGDTFVIAAILAGLKATQGDDEESEMALDPDFKWTADQGLPQEIVDAILSQTVRNIKYLYRLIDDLGPIHVPMPLLENVSKLVTMHAQIHGAIDSPKWLKACQATFEGQHESYLQLLRIYLEVCHDVIEQGLVSSIMDDAGKVPDEECPPAEEDFPSLGDVNVSNITGDIQTYGMRPGQARKMKATMNKYYSAGDAFPDLGDTLAVAAPAPPPVNWKKPIKQQNPGSLGLQTFRNNKKNVMNLNTLESSPGAAPSSPGWNAAPSQPKPKARIGFAPHPASSPTRNQGTSLIPGLDYDAVDDFSALKETPDEEWSVSVKAKCRVCGANLPNKNKDICGVCEAVVNKSAMGEKSAQNKKKIRQNAKAKKGFTLGGTMGYGSYDHQ